MKYVLIGLLKAYRLVISPLYGDVCRYWPSCSAYALQSVQVHGALRGTWLTIRRLVRCHPWAKGGFDPVPGTPEFEREMQERAESAATMEPRGVDKPGVDKPGVDKCCVDRHRANEQSEVLS